MTLLTALVFAFVFHGVSSLKDACNSTAPGSIRPLLIGLAFILLAYVLTRVL